MNKAIALQPELRALMMFDTLPEGCIAFACTDGYAMPHIRPGEFVVVDTKDTKPRNGEVYVIQWYNGRRCICQARISPRDNDLWYVGALNNPGREAVKAAIANGMAIDKLIRFSGWSDGPYDDLEYLESKLVGAVIGIYQPNFEEPKRIVS